jgi:hypothetical protein
MGILGKIKSVFTKDEKPEHLKKSDLDESQLKEIQKIVEARKIGKLVHYTRIENLFGILKYGLVPVDYQIRMGIQSVKTSIKPKEWEKLYTSCTIEHPDSYELYKKNKKSGNAKWALVFIDSKVLYSGENNAYYFNRPARFHLRKNKVADFNNPEAFESMFGKLINPGGRRPFRRKNSLKSFYPTDPGAEVLIDGIIDNKFIDCICFETKKDMEAYQRMFSEDLLENYNYLIFKDYFRKRD